MPGFFIYSGVTQPFEGAPKVPFERWNANKNWALHTYNKVVLGYIQRETRDAHEKLQAGNEIEIAERKRQFWVRHPNFDAAAAALLFTETYNMEVPR